MSNSFTGDKLDEESSIIGAGNCYKQQSRHSKTLQIYNENEPTDFLTSENDEDDPPSVQFFDKPCLFVRELNYKSIPTTTSSICCSDDNVVAVAVTIAASATAATSKSKPLQKTPLKNDLRSENLLGNEEDDIQPPPLALQIGKRNTYLSCASDNTMKPLQIYTNCDHENSTVKLNCEPNCDVEVNCCFIDPVSEDRKPTIIPKPKRFCLENLLNESVQLSNTLPISAMSSFSNQLSADMCNFKSLKSRRLEYSLKYLKCAQNNPSQDSAFGSLTENESLANNRLNSFQSVSSPIGEDVEKIDTATVATIQTSNKTYLELATLPRETGRIMSQDSAISSPCENTPNNNLKSGEDYNATAGDINNTTNATSGATVTLGSEPEVVSAAICSEATTSSVWTQELEKNIQTQTNNLLGHQFDPPTILVNDQNSIYSTSPCKRSNTTAVFSQKYRVSSFEDMSPVRGSNLSGASNDKYHLKNVNRLTYRSLEDEKRIDSAFMPVLDRTHSENRVNTQSDKYKKLTHISFCIRNPTKQGTSACNTATSGQPKISKCKNSCSSFNTVRMSEKISLEMLEGDTNQQTSPNLTCLTSSHRQTLWRDSKFYRKNHKAKSDDSLLEMSLKLKRHSPVLLWDNYGHNANHSLIAGKRSLSRHSLMWKGSICETTIGSSNNLGTELTVTTSFCNNPTIQGDDIENNRNYGNNQRRYCMSKSEDLGDVGGSDSITVMDTRKAYSERHLVTLTTLKQTAINNTTTISDANESCCYLSEADISSMQGNTSPTPRHTNTHCTKTEEFQTRLNNVQYDYFLKEHNHKPQQCGNLDRRCNPHHGCEHYSQSKCHKRCHLRLNDGNDFAVAKYSPYSLNPMNTLHDLYNEGNSDGGVDEIGISTNKMFSSSTSLPNANIARHHYKNQFSWSSCSINHLKTTKIKTTSLAILTSSSSIGSKNPADNLETKEGNKQNIREIGSNMNCKVTVNDTSENFNISKVQPPHTPIMIPQSKETEILPSGKKLNTQLYTSTDLFF